jgi:hypothetical protein
VNLRNKSAREQAAAIAQAVQQTFGPRSPAVKIMRQLRASMRVLEPRACANLMRRWARVFCADQHEKTGRWKYNGYYWHTFSYEYTAHRSNAEARRLYKAQSPDEYFIVAGTVLLSAVRCKSDRLPDFSFPAMRLSGTDIYVFPADLAWTMVFTHHDPYIGPFFAKARPSRRT